MRRIYLDSNILIAHYSIDHAEEAKKGLVENALDAFDQLKDVQLCQSARTARDFAQSLMALISSARVTLSGCVPRISSSKIAVVSCCFRSNAVYKPAMMACSISAPENPSHAAPSAVTSNSAASRPRFFRCKVKSAARTSALGR